MGGAKKRVKKFVNSDAGRIIVPLAAGYATGGVVGAQSVPGAVGNTEAVAGAAGAGAAMATSGALTPPELPVEEDLGAPVLATPLEISAQDRATRAKQKLAALAGRGSTILTQGQTLGGGSSTGKSLLGL